MREEKIAKVREGRTKRIRQSEVLHRALYPNAHGNGFFFFKKEKEMHNEIMSHFSKIFFDEGYSAQILEARIGPGVTIVDGVEIRLCK